MTLIPTHCTPTQWSLTVSTAISSINLINNPRTQNYMSHNCSFFLTAGIAVVVDYKAEPGTVHITLKTQKVVQ